MLGIPSGIPNRNHAHSSNGSRELNIAIGLRPCCQDFVIVELTFVHLNCKTTSHITHIMSRTVAQIVAGVMVQDLAHVILISLDYAMHS